MIAELDYGVRCEEHTGEVFPPRCRDCDATAEGLSRTESLDDAGAHSVDNLDAAANGYCPEHPEYPSNEHWPCARCIREASGVTT